MAEAIAIIGATAAIPQITKYVLGACGKIYSISTSMHSASQSIQQWEDQLEFELGLLAEFENNQNSIDNSAHKILLQCKNEGDAAENLLQRLTISRGRGKIARLKETMRMLHRREEMNKRLSKIRQLNESLNQQSMQ
jgi:hypothetical protein